MPLSKSQLVDAALLLALILLGLVGYKLSPLLLPQADQTASPDPACRLNQTACAAALPGGGRLLLALEPRPLPVAAALRASVELADIEAQSVAIDFAGVTMNMGLNRATLVAAGAGRYVGDVVLPACVTGRMEWQATVLVESGRRRIAVPFRFAAGE